MKLISALNVWRYISLLAKRKILLFYPFNGYAVASQWLLICPHNVVLRATAPGGTYSIHSKELSALQKY